MAKEVSLVLIKPDGAARKLTGLVIDRLEKAGLELIGAKVTRVTEELARKHYDGLKDKPFFPGLIEYIQGKEHDIPDGRILALCYYGENAIKAIRDVAGATNPEEASGDTIRGQFGRITTKGQFENVLHASSDPADGERETKLWFKPEELALDIFTAA